MLMEGNAWVILFYIISGNGAKKLNSNKLFVTLVYRLILNFLRRFDFKGKFIPV